MHDITVLILTFNEERHIERCIKSLQSFAERIIIIDSYSTDNTRAIAKQMGASIYTNGWINYAKQFQWGLDHAEITTKWVMRMDADEYVTDELQNEILELNGNQLLDESISGLYVTRRVYFMGKWIKHGGYYPIKLLRIWQFNCGSIEERWMDEHIILNEGKTKELKYDIVDENLNNLTWWSEKHNNYATREAIDILNKTENLFGEKSIESTISNTAQDKRIRWFKNNVFLRTPRLFRAFFYFNYRFIFRLGFLDGKQGLIWHVLQGFWYRFLVDAKIEQIKQIQKKTNIPMKEVIENYYGRKIE